MRSMQAVRRKSSTWRVAMTIVGVATVLAMSPAAVQAADAPLSLPTVTVTGTKAADATPVEASYAESVFTHLSKASRYPTSREASLERPSGTATVWVEVQRNGKVVGHGIEQSSGSPILDNMAIELVTRAKYMALPKDGWPDQPKHRFVVSYKFDGPAMTAGKSGKP